MKKRKLKPNYKKFYFKILAIIILYISFTKLASPKPLTPEEATENYFTSFLSRNKFEIINKLEVTYKDKDKAIVDILGRTPEKDYPFARYDVYVKRKGDYWMIDKLVPKDIL